MHFMYPETQIRPLIPMYQGKLHVHFSENRIAQDLNLEGITYLSLDRKKKTDVYIVQSQDLVPWVQCSGKLLSCEGAMKTGSPCVEEMMQANFTPTDGLPHFVQSFRHQNMAN